MKYHNITKADMLNGEGLRVVLWTSGCSHNCPGCHNAITWNKDNGILFDDDAKDEIFAELENEWCSGLTLSGGDPLFSESRKTIAELVKEVKEKYPKKTIWCYTGFIWEELIRLMDEDDNLKIILNNIDVLLDGKFVLRLALEKLQYVGSSNQSIIDVKKSLEKDKKILYIDNNKWLEGEEI